MTHISAHAGHGDDHHAATFTKEQATPPAFGMQYPLIVGGVALLAAGGIGGGMVVGGKHGLAAYHAAVMAALAPCLGALILTMAFHLVNAGWWAGFRRQVENLAFLAPVFGALALTGMAADFFLLHGEAYANLSTWMDSHFAGDYLLKKKEAFLNPAFFFGRGVAYVVVWALLARMLYSLSVRADAAPDPWLTAKARFNSAWGILIAALTTAFASFDWLMALDYRFFSTMFPVRYFATAAFMMPAIMVLALTFLRSKGKLGSLVTQEHYHDLGKLMFAFTVFWAYITYFEYFLYWYASIPEETAYFVARQQGGWMNLFTFLCLGHFVVPFLILIFRKVKRTPALLCAVAVWFIVVHSFDMLYLVRPMAFVGVKDPPGSGTWWVEAAAMAGAWSLLAGLMMWRMGAASLVASGDPRLGEALKHKNYV